MQADSRIFIAGHRGLVGSAITAELRDLGFTNLITRTHAELDLGDMSAVEKFFAKERPEYVILAAAKVGGIYANNIYRADFLYENLAIQNAVIYNAYKHGVKKLLFLGSSCIYPKLAPQPIVESALLTSELEYTNEPYAIAKIAGMKLCESFALQYGCNFISVMPTNLYGEQDNFNLQNSHVFPALLRKMHLAKLLACGDMEGIARDVHRYDARHELDRESIIGFLTKHGISANSVRVWGSGNVRREFLHAADMARACVYVLRNIDFCELADMAHTALLGGDSNGCLDSGMQEYKAQNLGAQNSSIQNPSIKETREIRNTHINIGYGSDVSIRELAEHIREIVGFSGELEFDTSKPDGTPRKLMDSSKIAALGWKPSIDLESGIKRVYEHYCRL